MTDSPLPRRSALLAMLLALVASTARAATEIPFGPNTVVRLADVPEGIEAITRRDDYIRQLSPFDRQVRPRTDRDVSEEEFLAFLRGHVAPWSEAEIAKVVPLVEELARKCAPWNLPLPPVVLLVKTTGREEGGAAYCRGPAIILPQNMVDGPIARLENILPHELFHVLSNQNPNLRDALYASIGFKPCDEVPLPEPLAARKMTNPDAPVTNHFISVVQDGRPLDLVPVLFSKSRRYDAGRGGSLFSYLTFKLMQVAGEGRAKQPVLANGEVVLFDPAKVDGYHEQIGRNTKYIIHPEEVLADNFVLLLEGRIDLPTPRVIEEMGKILQANAGEPPAAQPSDS
jgi:hypothetical protein